MYCILKKQNINHRINKTDKKKQENKEQATKGSLQTFTLLNPFKHIVTRE